jgi:threonylcarbamoyladenosine tRNA methylthiotransferase CDKAL1
VMDAELFPRPAAHPSNNYKSPYKHLRDSSTVQVNDLDVNDAGGMIRSPDVGSRMRKISIEAYGCSANMSDSHAIAGILNANGFEIVDKSGESDLNIIVTCSVKDTTEHRMLSRIRALSRTGKPLIVAGCLVKTETARIEKLFSSASLLGPRSLSKTIDCVDASLRGRRTFELGDVDGQLKLNIPRVRMNPVTSIVQIGIGCMSECSFCQTRIAKGGLTSYRVGDIIRTITADVRDGSKEVWLSSTDNGCYGLDIGTDLVYLLQKCRSIAGDFRIRIGMMNPMYMTSIKRGLIQLFEDSSRFFRFLHIPVQSGSAQILRSMRRGHTAKMYNDIVKLFRSKYPDITIGTDVIVGFPGESDADFEETLSLLSESKPDIINCSRYSVRSGTVASLMMGRLGSEVLKKRSRRVHDLCTRISQERNLRWLGWRGTIVIDELAAEFVQGRNYAYKPIFIRRMALRGNSPRLGDGVKVHVVGCSKHALEAEIIH